MKQVKIFPDKSIHLSVLFVAIQCGTTPGEVIEILSRDKSIKTGETLLYPDGFIIALVHFAQHGKRPAIHNLKRVKDEENFLDYFEQYA